MLLYKNNWGTGLALPVNSDHPVLDKSCDPYKGMLFNSAQDVFEIGTAASQDIQWWLGNKGESAEGVTSERERIQKGLESFFGSMSPWNKDLERNVNILKGRGAESYPS